MGDVASGQGPTFLALQAASVCLEKHNTITGGSRRVSAIMDLQNWSNLAGHFADNCFEITKP